jgi:hypothetical protein
MDGEARKQRGVAGHGAWGATFDAAWQTVSVQKFEADVRDPVERRDTTTKMRTHD